MKNTFLKYHLQPNQRYELNLRTPSRGINRVLVTFVKMKVLDGGKLRAQFRLPGGDLMLFTATGLRERRCELYKAPHVGKSFRKLAQLDIQANKFSPFRKEQPVKQHKERLQLFLFKVVHQGIVTRHGEAAWPNAQVGVAILSDLNPLADFIHVRRPNY